MSNVVCIHMEKSIAPSQFAFYLHILLCIFTIILMPILIYLLSFSSFLICMPWTINAIYPNPNPVFQRWEGPKPEKFAQRFCGLTWARSPDLLHSKRSTPAERHNSQLHLRAVYCTQYMYLVDYVIKNWFLRFGAVRDKTSFQCK